MTPPDDQARPQNDAGEQAQRADKWLWFARFFKTRGLATKLINSGKVRLTRSGKTDILRKPAFLVRSGDVLTFPLPTRVAVIEVLEPGRRRGPASEAQTLYKDISPPQPKPLGKPAPPKGSRPTKKQRRAIERWRNDTS